MRVVIQILKEFWFPFIAASCWTMYNIYSQHNPDWSVVKEINIFGPAFFFFSWLPGHYFRIRKQVNVEDNFDSIQTKMATLLDQIENKTKALINHMTGGESFCYVTISPINHKENNGRIAIIHKGEHNLFDVNMRMVDIDGMDLIKDNATLDNINKYTIQRTYGTLISGFAAIHEPINLSSTGQCNFNIFWSARNGGFDQMLRLRKIDEQWRFAIKIMRNGKLLFEQIQEDFPRNTKGEVDWFGNHN